MKRAVNSDLDKLLEPARKQRNKSYQHAALAGVNKSELVREWKAKNPNATAQQIVEGLGLGGVIVSPALVYQALKAKPENGNGGNRRRSSGEVDLAALVKAKRLAEAMGGIEAAREALAAYAQLIG